MTDPFFWWKPISFEVQFPGAEGNYQNFIPLTHLLSPMTTINNYEGDPAIEEKIIRDVASFGKQLGVVSEAVLELAKEGACQSPAIERLAKLAKEIDEVKKQHRETTVERVRQSFTSLLDDRP